MHKTTQFAKLKDIQRKWYVVDAADVVLGKLSTQVANLLRGKNKPSFTAHVDCGDHVVVINAEKIVLTGNKWKQKMYRRHSGYLGNMKEEKAADVLIKNPKRIIEEAVYGMLPKNKLRKHYIGKLYIYPGAEHKHDGQQPIPFEIK